MKSYPILFCLSAWLLFACEPTPKADLVLINGRVWTGGDSARFVEAVAVQGHVILKTGSNEEIKKMVSKETKTIDLGGRLVIPGFNDAHIHFLSGSVGLTEVDLNDATSISDVVYRIKKFAAEHPGKKWITGRGWQYTMFAGGYPTRTILDSALKDRNVFIRAYDGHSAWANTFALKTAGIDRRTVFKGFGEMIRDRSGEPTGVFKEHAMGLIGDSIPALTREEKLDALRLGLKKAASLGITSLANASGTVDEFQLYKQLLNNNELTTRVAAAFSVSVKTTDEDIHSFVLLKDSTGKNPWLNAPAIKFVLDGVIESHTAGMLAPYSNLGKGETDPSGTLSWPLERYQQRVRLLDKLGFRLYTHAIGDRAVREALNAYESAAHENGTTARHRIEHIENIHPDDVPRFAKLGVLPSMEPIHAEPGAVAAWEQAVGKDRLPMSFAWASMLKSGAHLVYSSDWPACVNMDPIRGLHTAVTRRTVDGQPPQGWVAEQKISITDALKAYTEGGAYSSFEERSKGKLAPGYFADLVVLSQDLFTIDPMKTFETKVLMTVVDGKVVFGNL